MKIDYCYYHGIISSTLGGVELRKILLTFAVFAVLASPVQSQDTVHGFVESRRTLIDNPIQGGQFHFWLQGPFRPDSSSVWGWYAWALVNRDYSLAYIGPTYQATPWLQVGIAVGAESGYKDPLLGSFALVTGDRWSVLGVYEYVEGFHWWQAVGNHNVGSCFGVGFHGEKDYGIGPRIQARFGPEALSSTLWLAAPVKDDDGLDIGLIAGVNLAF